jgi:protein tyrosine/serine phosphatase
MMDDTGQDTTFFNFREVCMGAIAPRRLYRSSHPITGDDRDFIMAELAETAKIAAVLNLADDERALKQKADLIPWHNKLFQEGCVIALNMDFDFRSDEFSSKLNQGIKFMLNHKGPYLIHCLQGIDRTGFFVMLLEMAMGAGKNEIIDDYMKSFLGRPGFEEESAHYKREYSNLFKVLRSLNNGRPIITESMAGIAEKYIFENVGLLQSELDMLRLALSKNQD